MSAEARLAALGLVLPQAAAAVASYVPTTRTGNLLYISGQLPMQNGTMDFVGRLGDTASEETASAAARLCALNLLAQIRAATGSLDRVKACLRLGSFIAATPDYTNHSVVMNAASDIMEAVFGEAGRHARTTIGVASLPRGAVVEVEGLFELHNG